MCVCVCVCWGYIQPSIRYLFLERKRGRGFLRAERNKGRRKIGLETCWIFPVVKRVPFFPLISNILLLASLFLVLQFQAVGKLVSLIHPSSKFSTTSTPTILSDLLGYSPRLSCSVVYLVCEIFFFLFFSLFGLAAWHVGSYFPDQGSNPCPLQWTLGALTTRPPGKSPVRFLILSPNLFPSNFQSLIIILSHKTI